MLDTNKRLKYVTSVVLRRRLARKEIIFSSSYYNGTRYPNYNHISKDEISHWPTIVLILRDFGNSILNLKISNQRKLPESLAKSLYQMVNTYCAETLIQLSIQNQINNFFIYFDKPFEKVERLTLDGYSNDFNRCKFQFGELFPSLRYLDVKRFVMISKLNLNAKKLPLLQDLAADVQGFEDFTSFKEFLRKNPQIRRLELNSVQPELLQFINDQMQSLEELEIWSSKLNDINQVICDFSKLKKFTEHGYYYKFPLHIQFGNLEEIFMFASDEESNKFIQLILDNKETLKKVLLLISLSNSDILELANGNLTISKLQFSCAAEVSIDNIFKVIENNKHLRELHVTLSFAGQRLKQTAFDMLKERFGDEWDITETRIVSMHYLSMKRKPAKTIRYNPVNILN